MTIHVHHLTGCGPTPLAHYLKALGMLRLVAEQRDPGIRGWWRNESFYIGTVLNREDLLRFFLEDYQPTPLIDPWNGGSGFYPRDNRDGIDAIASSQASRFSAYRQAIALGRGLTGGLARPPKSGDEKNALLRQCRQQWRRELLNWFEAAVVLNAQGEPKYPAMLGTGGNDGRLDFTNNFMQRLSELFDCEHPQSPARSTAHGLLEAAFYERPEAGLGQQKIGQFLPGAAGGANSSTGFRGDSLTNPWDFVLMMEGTIVFGASVVRRTQARELPQAAAPFALVASAAGFGTAAEADKTRGEQWMPLWGRPSAFSEVQSLVAEGRSEIAKKTASRPVDFGRAIARLGVAKGITAFQRYGYIERNGQANLAVPLGRWAVKSQPHQDLIDEIADWVDRVRWAGTDRNAPASIGRAARVCEEAILACCRNGNDPRRWQDLLMALGAAESQLIRSPAFTCKKRQRPLPQIGGSWFKAADDGSAEMRLALSLAAQGGPADHYRANPRDPIRRHFLPLEQKSLGTRQARFRIGNEVLADPPEVVCSGDSLEQVCIALLRRRLVEAGQISSPQLPLVPVGSTAGSLCDLVRLLDGDLDEARILALARPLMAIDWRSLSTPRSPRRPDFETLGAVGVYGLFRLAYSPQPVRVVAGAEPVAIRLDPSIFARLADGDLPRAVATATRRLAASGLRPHVRHAAGSSALARRLAMSLAFPVQANDTAALARRLTRQTVVESSSDGPAIPEVLVRQEPNQQEAMPT